MKIARIPKEGCNFIEPNIQSAFKDCHTFEEVLERYKEQKKKPATVGKASQVESEVVEEHALNVKELAESINAKMPKPAREYTESLDIVNLEHLFTTRISVQKALNMDPAKIKALLAKEIVASPDNRENLLLELNKSTLKMALLCQANADNKLFIQWAQTSFRFYKCKEFEKFF